MTPDRADSCSRGRSEDADTWGLAARIGTFGMVACIATGTGLVIVAGMYSLLTGEALRLPIMTIGIAWFAALAVSECLAFGWPMIRQLLIALAIGVPVVTVLIELLGIS